MEFAKNKPFFSTVDVHWGGRGGGLLNWKKTRTNTKHNRIWINTVTLKKLCANIFANKLFSLYILILKGLSINDVKEQAPFTFEKMSILLIPCDMLNCNISEAELIYANPVVWVARYLR